VCSSDLVTDRVITSTEALQLDKVPGSAIVLGGGVIGVEFASVWSSFGADVTIVEGLKHLVANEDETISKNLERAFKKRKIGFKLGVMLKGVEETADGVKVTLEDGSTLEAEYLLVAVGRGPVTEGLGFEEQVIPMHSENVLDKERIHTGVGNSSICSDSSPGLQRARRDFGQCIFIAENCAAMNPVPVLETGIPRVTYCEPENFSVGLS